jgi:glycosyltransferase involved in cell wall biosynthesis
MTLLTIPRFQPHKRNVMIARISIDFSDISVILPVKNNQKGINLFLSEFLKTHTPAMYPREIIIVDNSSRPPIIIPQEFSNDELRIALLSCSTPGPASARNLGIQVACGKWILFTDSDCIPSFSFLEGYFATMNGSIGYAGKVKSWGKDRLSQYYESQEILAPSSVVEDGEIRPEYLITANALVWKQALEYIEGFNYSILLAAGEDIDLGFRLREIGTLAYADTACVYHNFDDGFLGFMKRFIRYGRGNKIISRLYDLDLTPKIFEAKKPLFLNRILSRIQYVCLFWGYRTG